MQSEKVAELRCTITVSEKIASLEAKLPKVEMEVGQAQKEVGGINGPSCDVRTFNRSGTNDLLRRLLFVTSSLTIYGGVSGLFHYGPPGCEVENNLIAT